VIGGGTESQAEAFLRAGETTLADDAKAFSDAREAWRRRGRLLRAGAVIAILLGCGAFILWQKRVKRALGPAAAPGKPGDRTPAPAEIVPDTVLEGNYRIVREVGRGGMSVVYEAVDIALDRQVAIKLMRADVSKAGLDPEMFLTEARLVAGLKHPNIVAIHAAFRDAERLFLVFEYVQGKSLARLLGNGQRISLRSTKTVVKQVAAALDFAHRCKIIHRDLKPGNIMITGDGTAKVMDFGIAHVARVTAATANRAEACGTPEYMAPEQELGVVSRESDLYALGVMLYEMLVGRRPFDGPDYLAQKQAMRYTPPSQVLRDIPTGFDDVVKRALQPEVQQRFHTAQELVSALDAVC
jgi:serine/threonine-protein kinase